MLRRFWTTTAAAARLLPRSRPLSCLAATAAAAPLRSAAAPATGVLRDLLTAPWTRSNLAGSFQVAAVAAAPLRLRQPSQLQLRTFASKKHKNLLRYAKGYRGRSKNCFRIAVRRVEKAWQYAYRDRRRKKREWRKLWIMRLQAAVRQYGYRYSQLVPALRAGGVTLNRKVLAEVAANEPFAFYAVLRALEATGAGLQQRRGGGDYLDGGERLAA